MKVISIFICFLMVVTPVMAHADEVALDGKVTSILQGEPAPYTGVLLDPVASSKMLVDNKYVKLELELQLRKEFKHFKQALIKKFGSNWFKKLAINWRLQIYHGHSGKTWRT